MRPILGIVFAVTCFAQGNQNVTWTGLVDAGGAIFKPPTATFASAPAATLNATYTFTDASSAGVCTGGGSAIALCRGNGSGWDALGGSGGSQATIFSGGTQIQRSVQCAYGTVPYTSLTAAAASQEITIQTGISGNVRWEHIGLSETTQFATTVGLTVSMGRPGATDSEMTGGTFALMISGSDANFQNWHPPAPQLTSTYSIVLNFAVSSGNVNAATAGVVTWEACGYAAR